MRYEGIPPFKIHPNIPLGTSELRNVAPQNLVKVVDLLKKNGSFGNIKEISESAVEPLNGGINSAAYWIGVPGHEIVVKLQKKGVDEEAEWLKAFANKGVRVPKVEMVGVVPGEEGKQSPVKFIALEGIVNNDYERAKTGRDIVAGPDVFREISHQMGFELAKIHQTTSDKKFGEYADEEGSNRADTWADYLLTNLRMNRLAPLGVSESEQASVVSALRAIAFPDRGVYISGDFALHNILVESLSPPLITIIDPNLMIADPYFDLASLYNLKELKEAVYKIDPNNAHHAVAWWEKDPVDFQSLMNAYFKATGIIIDPKRLAANQLVKMLQTIDGRQTMGEEQSKSYKPEFGKNLRNNLVREKVDYLLGKAA